MTLDWDRIVLGLLAGLSPEQVKISTLAGEPITGTLTQAPGNDAPLGGLRVVTESLDLDRPRRCGERGRAPTAATRRASACTPAGGAARARAHAGEGARG